MHICQTQPIKYFINIAGCNLFHNRTLIIKPHSVLVRQLIFVILDNKTSWNMFKSRLTAVLMMYVIKGLLPSVLPMEVRIGFMAMTPLIHCTSCGVLASRLHFPEPLLPQNVETDTHASNAIEIRTYPLTGLVSMGRDYGDVMRLVISTGMRLKRQ